MQKTSIVVLVLVILLLVFLVWYMRTKACFGDCKKYRDSFKDFLENDKAGIAYTSAPEQGTGHYVDKEKLLNAYPKFLRQMKKKDSNCDDIQECNKYIAYTCNDAGYDYECTQRDCKGEDREKRMAYGLKCADIWA